MTLTLDWVIQHSIVRHSSILAIYQISMRMGEKICESHILIFFQVQSYATQKLRSTRKFTQRLSQVMDTSAAKMRP